MNTCFFKHLANRRLLIGFALFDMTLGKSPMSAAPVFDKQITQLAVYHAVNNRTARTLIEALQLIFPALFGKGNSIFDLIRNEPHALWSNNINSGAAVVAFDCRNYPAVKGSDRMINAHNIGAVGDAVISLFPFDCAEIELIDKTELSVYGADRVGNPDSDIFAEHNTTPFERLNQA